MSQYRTNDYWRNTDCYQPFELRAHRFREEMRPVFFQWLGVGEGSVVLDGGCGTGVFTRYLAKGLTTGHITGFDINETFLAFGREKAAELGLADKMTLEAADGYHLPYPDGCFDAVTNYTYLGCLADARAGLKELIRVCKPGGTLSYAVASTTIPGVAYGGDYPFDGAAEMRELAGREATIYQAMRGTGQLGEIALFAVCGLTDIRIYPFAHLICYNDCSLPADYRKTIALGEIRDEIRWLPERYEEYEHAYREQGFSRDDLQTLIRLLERKADYLSQHFDADHSYEWHGGFNFIVTGRK